MAKKKTAKKARKSPKVAKVQTYKDSSETERKPSKGYIQHPWYKLAAAAIVGALLGWLLRRRK